MVALPIGNKITPRTTPLHVYQLVMQLLRITLKTVSESDDYPFIYTDDIATTGVILDTSFNKEAPTYGKKPLIIVSRGNVSTQPAVLGDRASGSLGTTLSSRTTLVQSSVQVKVISKRSGEADILSNVVYNFLLTCRTVLPALTSIHNIQAISMSPIAQLEEDDHMFYTQASIDYTMQYQWTWDIVPTLLEEIGFHINDKLTIDIK